MTDRTSLTGNTAACNSADNIHLVHIFCQIQRLTNDQLQSIQTKVVINASAVDGDCANRIITKFAADSGYRSIILAGYGQRTHVFLVGLGINSKTVALCHIDAAVDGQACAICQNQMNLAADGDAAADGHNAVDYIPAAIPCGCAAFHHSDIICCLFTAVFVQIGNAVLRQ